MSEPAPSSVAGQPASNGQEGLTAEAIESVLADFRTWLQHQPTPATQPAPDAESPVDLHTLLAQFIALRHEVNLQTRATRAQQEQNVVTLEDLRAALDLLRRSQEGAKQADRESQDEIMRPLLKTLIDVNDALALAEREVRRLRENVQRS